jgi:tetratricopeptide (TPR) repeat protein
MPDELAKIYREIEKNPTNANLYLELSRYYTDVQVLDSALNNALIAIRLDPNNSDMYVVVSDIYLLMQYFDNAEEMLERAIALDNKNNEAYLKLGGLYCGQGNYAQSEKILIKAIQLQSHNPKAYFILARNFQDKGDTVSAIRSYLVAAEQDPDYFEAYLELGVLYHYKHNRLAIDYYNNALNVQPNNVHVLYDLAMFYQETEDYDKALEKYRMILQIEPNHRNSLHNMGWV